MATLRHRLARLESLNVDDDRCDQWFACRRYLDGESGTLPVESLDPALLEPLTSLESRLRVLRINGDCEAFATA